MNFAQQMQLKALPEAEKILYLKSIKPGLSDEQAQDWIESIESPIQHVQQKTEKVDKLSDLLVRVDILRQNAKPATPPEPPDYFARDILLNQYLLGGSTEFDEASLHHPRLRETMVIRSLRAVRPRVALVIGEPGSGKTWGTLAYMNSLAKAKGVCKVEYADAAFVTAFRVSEMFHNSKKFHAELDELLKKKHLLIDDLGAEPAGFRGDDFVAYFDYLFSERHKFRRSTFITSNATIEGIKKMYGSRFTSRFNENGSLIETTEADMRGKNA